MAIIHLKKWASVINVATFPTLFDCMPYYFQNMLLPIDHSLWRWKFIHSSTTNCLQGFSSPLLIYTLTIKNALIVQYMHKSKALIIEKISSDFLKWQPAISLLSHTVLSFSWVKIWMTLISIILFFFACSISKKSSLIPEFLMFHASFNYWTWQQTQYWVR